MLHITHNTGKRRYTTGKNKPEKRDYKDGSAASHTWESYSLASDLQTSEVLRFDPPQTFF